MYDFTGKMYTVCDFLHENEYFLFYELFLFTTEGYSGFNLFTAAIYDSYIKDTLFLFEISEDFVRKYAASLDVTLFSIYHPEFGYFKRIENGNFFFNMGSNLHFIIYDNIKAYSLDLPISIALQLYFFLFCVGIFISFFFSFYNNANKEEWAADVDYSISNLSFEVEKEIFAADDAVYLILILFFFFSAYFGFLFLGIGAYINDASIFYWGLPVFAALLLFIPLNLLFDFGLLFSLYLRGSSKTSSFFAELCYDYIGVVAFFTRLTVQFVRLVLMFVSYCMMHDAVMLGDVSSWFLPFGDSLFNEILNIRYNTNGITYFFLFVLPARIFYWMYEVVHTFFIVTAQFAAFFTIAVWLFLLFYTYFVFEKMEKHFTHLRSRNKSVGNNFDYFLKLSR